MSRLVVNRHARAFDAVSAALAETERVIENTRREALGIFHTRGVIDREALANWLNGASNPCWHVTDVVERESGFVITIALPGADLRLMELTREPRRLVIRTRAGSDSAASRRLRLDLPFDLTSDRVRAELREGALVISVPKVLD